MNIRIGDRDPCELCNMQSNCQYCPFERKRNKKLDKREGNKKMKLHELKCWSGPFNEILSGKKKFEYRLNDRDYEIGDELNLCEWNIGTGYTGREIKRKVTSILKAGFELPVGFCIMSIE